MLQLKTKSQEPQNVHEISAAKKSRTSESTRDEESQKVLDFSHDERSQEPWKFQRFQLTPLSQDIGRFQLEKGQESQKVSSDHR